jgi:hypothetical protein
MPNKFRGFVGGFGSGKTWVGCMGKAQHFLKHPQVTQGYFAPTYPHIRDIFYPTMEEVAHNFGFKIKVKTGDKEVDYYRGRKYYGRTICRSLDNPEMIIGFKIGHGLVDELDVLPTDKALMAWKKMIARLRWVDNDKVKNGLDVTTTPEGFRSVYKIFVEDVLKKPELVRNYGLIQASTYDNGKNLPDDYIDSLLEAYPDELINAYLHGKFVNLQSGSVYNAYNRVTHRSNETIREKELLRIGMDFNVTNMSAVVYVLRGDDQVWHAVDELKGVYDTPAMIALIRERYSEHHIRVYPDASGKSRKTVNASTSDIGLLEAIGFSVYANPSNPLVRDRVIATNNAFSKGMLKINDDKCPEYAKCMEQLSYDKNGEPDKTSNIDHLPDAGTYPIAFSMPVIKPVAQIKVNFSR